MLEIYCGVWNTLHYDIAMNPVFAMLHPTANAENFHGGVHSVAYGTRLFVVCGLCDVTI